MARPREETYSQTIYEVIKHMYVVSVRTKGIESNTFHL